MHTATEHSPIDDLTYDVLTVLKHKARALAAYDRYIGDAEADGDEEARQVLEEIRARDAHDVRVLKEVLARRLDEDLGYSEEEDLGGDDDDVLDEDDDVLGAEYPSSPS